MIGEVLERGLALGKALLQPDAIVGTQPVQCILRGGPIDLAHGSEGSHQPPTSFGCGTLIRDRAYASRVVRRARATVVVAVVMALTSCADDPAEKVAARPTTTLRSVADSTTTTSSTPSSSTVPMEPVPTTPATAMTAAPSTSTSIPTSTAAPAGPSAVVDDQALGARLTLTSTSASVASGGSAQFDLMVENRSSKHLTYDSNVDFIALYAGDEHSWSPSCGYGRPAVVLYASIPPGGSHKVHAVYPSANEDYSDGCRVPVGDYELRATFRACQSEQAYDQRSGSACDPTTTAVVSLQFGQE